MATKEDIIKEILSNAILLRIGQRSIVIIKQRTAKGIFLEGSSPSADQYSTKPFAMPLGAIQKESLLNRILKGEPEETELFRAKSGRLWVAISKGYKWVREQSRKKSDSVNLRWTGGLMRSLAVNVNVDKGIIAIYHRDKRTQQLAYWHNEAGAGKGKVIRKYLGLSEEELQKLATTF